MGRKPVFLVFLALGACGPDRASLPGLGDPGGAAPRGDAEPAARAEPLPAVDSRAIEDRLDALTREVGELRREIRALRSQPEPARPADAPPIDVGELAARFAASREHEPEAAFAHAKTLIEQHPDAPQAAPAFAWLARQFGDHDPDRRLRYLNELVRRHPRSAEAAQACLALAWRAWEQRDAEGVLGAVAPLFDNPNGWERSENGWSSIGPDAARVVRRATQGTPLASRGMDAIRRIAAAMSPLQNVNGKDVPSETVADTEVQLAWLMQNSGRIPDAAALYQELKARMEGRDWNGHHRIKRLLELAEQGQPAPDRD